VTDTTGHYSLVVPYLGTVSAVVDGRAVGRARVTGSAYRGDFLIYPAFCIACYGTVSDARTLRPIAGATVAFGTKRVITEKDGWYRLDLACLTGPRPPGGTTFIYVSHLDYDRLDALVGRGIAGAYRTDYELQRR
jgi:hypothetical protein